MHDKHCKHFGGLLVKKSLDAEEGISTCAIMIYDAVEVVGVDDRIEISEF